MFGARKYVAGYLCALLVATTGCSTWTTARFGGNKPLISAPRLSAETVVLETAFIRVPLDDAALEGETWAACDEFVVTADVRRRLSDNGIRVGILGSTVPSGLKKLIDQQSSQNPLDTPPDSAVATAEKVDLTTRVQQLQCRSGKRNRIVTSIEHPELSFLEVDDQGNVRGETLHQAVCQFGMKVFPQGDGQVRIELSPEIEYGDVRNKFVASDGAFSLQPARERRVLERLRTEAVLTPGQFLIVGTMPESCGLGKQFFTTEGNASPRRTLLVMRVIQSHADDLFAPGNTDAPIETRAIESTP
jgi:hypothetical protein